MAELRYAGGCWVHDDEDCDIDCEMCHWFCPECPEDVQLRLVDNDTLQCPECDTKVFLPTHTSPTEAP